MLPRYLLSVSPLTVCEFGLLVYGTILSVLCYEVEVLKQVLYGVVLQ